MAELLRPSCNDRELTLSTTVDPRLSDRYVGDSERLRQVLINLASNAVRFTPQGSVSIGVRAVESGVEFSVSDTGIGIPPDKQAAIFDAFSQADNSTTRVYGGTGLGLTISQRLVALMGGRLGVESQVDVGSRFSFVVPLPVAEAPAEAPRAAPDQVPHVGARVLVVDDNSINQRVVQAMLIRLGCETTVVDDGAKAVDRVKNETFDLVLMDCQMPGMDGFEATRQIRRLPSDVPIVALTANVLEEDEKRCFEVGMDAFLAKPVRLDILQRALREAL